MAPASSNHIRVLPELRAVQVERSFSMMPCTNFYFDVKYDLGSTAIPSDFKRVTLPTAIMELFRSDAQVLEVPEPLWLRFAPRNIALLMSWRVGGIVRRRRRYAVTYAIENNDFHSLLLGGVKAPHVLSALVAKAVGLIYSRLLDRIAFGSWGAAMAYEALGMSRRIATRVIPELPSAASPTTETAGLPSVVFVGQLEKRKGIKLLMQSWPEVERAIPAAVLTIVGGGPLRSEVDNWVAERPMSRHSVGFVEHENVADIVTANQVSVLPSIRSGRWREQIGLPIGEALSHGLTVVTTTETGLADWLAGQGHHIVLAERGAGELARLLVRALMEPLDRLAVVSSLPATPGRIVADRWMHSVTETQPDIDN